MASNNSNQVKKKISHNIVDAIAISIKSKDDSEEIKDMFVNTPSFLEVVQSWRDHITGLDLFQTAILSEHFDIVKFLHQLSLKSSKYFVDGGSMMINSPLHLACLVGEVHILKFLISEEDSINYNNLLTTKGKIDYPSCTWELKDTPVLPFEICVQAQHVACSIYLSQLICQISKGFSKVFKIHKSSPIHQACYLGSASFLQLLINSGYQEQIHERNMDHFLPLHVAASCAMPECLEVLLANSAHVNAYTDHRSSLHLLYNWIWQPKQQVQCTEILLSHGVNVNAMDHNSNVPLDHLAWAYGQKEHNIKSRGHGARFLSALMHQASMEDQQDENLSQYQEGILRCFELLLKSGAATSVTTCPTSAEVDHTVMHTLLQNISWPHSSCLLQNPCAVYKALDLLFMYGSDPNTVAKTNKTSCFTLFLLHSLHEVQVLSLKRQFTHLFIANGASLECKVPAPANFRDYYSDRIWSVYPVNLARQEKHPIEVIHLLFNFMCQSHLFRALKCKKMQGWQLALVDAKEDTYRKAWLKLRKSLLHDPRTLKHCCKLTIVKELGLRGKHMEELPKELKMYVLSQSV